jgi:hypothetical protein
VVNAALLVVAFDPWARSVARIMVQAAVGAAAQLDGEREALDRLLVGGASTPSLAVLIGSAQTRLGDLRHDLEDRRVAHLTLERDEGAVWVGPAVIPDGRGCDWCWQARRRQHAEVLSATFGHDAGDAVCGADQMVLGAKATLAVARRVLRSPGVEAGVVRRFAVDRAAPTARRVSAVSGCGRCHQVAPRPAGWSLRGRGQVEVQPRASRGT